MPNKLRVISPWHAILTCFFLTYHLEVFIAYIYIYLFIYLFIYTVRILVVWNILVIFPFSREFLNPEWISYILEGLKPPTSIHNTHMYIYIYIHIHIYIYIYIIWHSFWHMFWHSVWHSLWHVFRPSALLSELARWPKTRQVALISERKRRRRRSWCSVKI